MNKDRRINELPSGCDIPYFKSNERVGIKWAGFRKRLGVQQEQVGLTDREMVRMLWRACKPHPMIQHYILGTLGPGMREKPMDMLLKMVSDWIMASMNRVIVAERGRGGVLLPPCRSPRWWTMTAQTCIHSWRG
jgi:hypothetical protein